MNERLDDEVMAEMDRQDARYGLTFGAELPVARIRLGVAVLEDETAETRDAWREDRRDDPMWTRTREEALQTAAVALRLVRQIDMERELLR